MEWFSERKGINLVGPAVGAWPNQTRYEKYLNRRSLSRSASRLPLCIENYWQSSLQSLSCLVISSTRNGKEDEKWGENCFCFYGVADDEEKNISFGRVFFVVRTSILVIERPQKKLSQIVSHVLVFFRFVKTRNHFFSFMTWDRTQTFLLFSCPANETGIKRWTKKTTRAK